MNEKGKINGIEVMVFEGQRIEKEFAPPGYPHFYHSRHHSNDWSVPISVERFGVAVNFWGTVFAKDPLLEDGYDYVNIKSIEFGDLVMDSMLEVCPDCASCLAVGDVVITGNSIYRSVECGCGYKGREEFYMTSYTAMAADEESDGSPDEGSVVCPCCHTEVALPSSGNMDNDQLEVSANCSFCGALVEASISCIFEGNIPLPMPA